MVVFILCMIVPWGRTLVSRSPFIMTMATLLAFWHGVEDLIQGTFETLHPWCVPLRVDYHVLYPFLKFLHVNLYLFNPVLICNLALYEVDRVQLSLDNDSWGICNYGKGFYWMSTPLRVGVQQHTRYLIKSLNEFFLMLMTYFYKETTATNNSKDNDTMLMIRIPNYVTH